MRCRFTAAVSSLLLVAVACGNEPPDDPEASGGNPGVVIDQNKGGSSGFIVAPPAGVSFVQDPTTGTCNIMLDKAGCTGAQYEEERPPLDIHILFDQTGSMCNCVDPEIINGPCPDSNCRKTRLAAVEEAMGEFLRDPASGGIKVGTTYFGFQPLGQAVDCNPASYATPAVSMGSLPNHADAIMASLRSISPTGETPTGAAIRGACTYASGFKRSHPGEVVVILLLTDGKPEAPISSRVGGCSPTLEDAAAAAAECRTGSPGINTFVLGVGPLLQNLNDIASAGGTDHAYLVESGDVSAQVVQALNAIRGAALPCQFQLPPPPTGQLLALDQVNVAYANNACQGTVFYHVGALTECGTDGGWYYDDPNAPTQVSLCPSSCDQVAAPGGQIMFSVGCTTIDRPQ